MPTHGDIVALPVSVHFTARLPTLSTDLALELEDYLTINELVYELVSTVACGGNLLMNIGLVMMLPCMLHIATNNTQTRS